MGKNISKVRIQKMEDLTQEVVGGGPISAAPSTLSPFIWAAPVITGRRGIETAEQARQNLCIRFLNDITVPGYS